MALCSSFTYVEINPFCNRHVITTHNSDICKYNRTMAYRDRANRFCMEVLDVEVESMVDMVELA